MVAMTPTSFTESPALTAMAFLPASLRPTCASTGPFAVATMRWPPPIMLAPGVVTTLLTVPVMVTSLLAS